MRAPIAPNIIRLHRHSADVLAEKARMRFNFALESSWFLRVWLEGRSRLYA